MIVDASALLAIVLHEPEGDRMSAAVYASPQRRMSPVNHLEALMVVESRSGLPGVEELSAIYRGLEIDLVAFGSEQLRAAHRAWQRYGKGRHRAGLNLGDCCAYAASVTTGEPLLFKGDDFKLTDVDPAPW